ncbi:MAG: hypothetical protein O7B99_10775 [Planctomycetota bacterium]|nr:hypothetical protein [Planctomycetota bacterium]
MPAFLWNVSWLEIVTVAILGVLVFGGRLPQIAAQVVRTTAKLRRMFDDLRRDTGIDRDMRDVQDSLRDMTREATTDTEPPSPPELPGEDAEDEEEPQSRSAVDTSEDRREPEEIL